MGVIKKYNYYSFIFLIAKPTILLRITFTYHSNGHLSQYYYGCSLTNMPLIINHNHAVHNIIIILR